MAADDDEFELVAASLRADASDLAAFVEALAVKLGQALPWYTRVHRRSTSLLSKSKRGDRIGVTVGEEQYVLNSDRGAIDARRATTVRGIVLKSEPVALDQWIDGLARAIAADARQSEQGRSALERLLGARRPDVAESPLTIEEGGATDEL